MEKQIWTPIIGYELLYEVNIYGAVRSLHKRNKGLILTQRIDRAGYLSVRLSNKAKNSTHYVHKILAQTFICNPGRKQVINHINGIKTDNNLDNLEWVTHAENIKHAYSLGLCTKGSKEIPVIDICSNIFFSSIRKAANHYSIPYSTCKGYLNGERKNITCLRYLKEDAA